MSAYTEYIKSKQWQNLSKLCRLVARNRCQMCGTSDSVMHSHHMSYERMGKEGEALDLCVLCEPCHVIYHRKHKYPPIKLCTRSKRLDDLSTALATHGVDVSYFHKNRILIDDRWIESLGLKIDTAKPCAPIVKKEKKPDHRFVKIDREIIELIKIPVNMKIFIGVFRLKLPLKKEWEYDFMGKDIRRKMVKLFKKKKLSEFHKARHKRHLKDQADFAAKNQITLTETTNNETE